MSISYVHLPSSSRVKEQYKVEMFFCDGPLLQNILRGDRDGHAPVKETFLRSRIYDLMREREKNVEPKLSYVARCSPRNRPFDSIIVANIFPRTRTSSCYGNLDCLFVTDNDISVSCAIEFRFKVKNKQLALE